MDKNKIMKMVRKSAEELQNGSNACYFFHLGKSKCKTGEMYLVLGWDGGFDDDGKNGEYRICCKLAYNCDALQCDYGFDWEMPYDEESGDVDDTNSEYDENYAEYLLDYWKKTYAAE